MNFNININRSFFYDFITERSLWIPITICGALKVVSSSVTACWNRCFPPMIDHTAIDPSQILPRDIVLEIFSYLSLHELGLSSRVSKQWNPLASKSNLWKAAIYREIAFSSKNWAQWDEDLVKGVDFAKELLSLPNNIVEELRRSYQAFPGKNLRETHVLVRKPKGLSINKLGELAKKYFPNNSDGYRYIWKSIVDELGDKAADESVWLLMTTRVIDGTKNKSYSEQIEIVAGLARKTLVPYEVPTILDADTCILAEYSRSKTRLLSDSSGIYTRCQENIQGSQVIAGGFSLAGLDIDHCSVDNWHFGVVAVRTFKDQ